MHPALSPFSSSTDDLQGLFSWASELASILVVTNWISHLLRNTTVPKVSLFPVEKRLFSIHIVLLYFLQNIAVIECDTIESSISAWICEFVSEEKLSINLLLCTVLCNISTVSVSVASAMFHKPALKSSLKNFVSRNPDWFSEWGSHINSCNFELQKKIAERLFILKLLKGVLRLINCPTKVIALKSRRSLCGFQGIHPHCDDDLSTLYPRYLRNTGKPDASTKICAGVRTAF